MDDVLHVPSADDGSGQMCSPLYARKRPVFTKQKISMPGWTHTDVTLTYHTKDVRVIHGACVVFRILHVLPVDHPGEGETEVGAECVDEHGAANVDRLK